MGISDGFFIASAFVLQVRSAPQNLSSQEATHGSFVGPSGVGSIGISASGGVMGGMGGVQVWWHHHIVLCMVWLMASRVLDCFVGGCMCLTFWLMLLACCLCFECSHLLCAWLFG